MLPAGLSALVYLWYRAVDISYYLKRLEQDMRSFPTCFPTFVMGNRYLLRLQVWHMIHRFNAILDAYGVAFTSGLISHRLWCNGQYPERETYCACFEKGGDFCLWS